MKFWYSVMLFDFFCLIFRRSSWYCSVPHWSSALVLENWTVNSANLSSRVIRATCRVFNHGYWKWSSLAVGNRQKCPQWRVLDIIMSIWYQVLYHIPLLSTCDTPDHMADQESCKLNQYISKTSRNLVQKLIYFNTNLKIWNVVYMLNFYTFQKHVQLSFIPNLI